MIRTDKMHQWASTQMAAHEPEPHKWPLEEGRKQNGLDYQGRYPEAAHSAIDWDDEDTRAIPGAGPIVWLVWGVCASIIAYSSWDFVAGFVQAWGRL